MWHAWHEARSITGNKHSPGSYLWTHTCQNKLQNSAHLVVSIVVATLSTILYSSKMKIFEWDEWQSTCLAAVKGILPSIMIADRIIAVRSRKGIEPHTPVSRPCIMFWITAHVWSNYRHAEWIPATWKITFTSSVAPSHESGCYSDCVRVIYSFKWSTRLFKNSIIIPFSF